MTTLIAVYNSEGCQGRCDAKCYDAAEPECECICGGRNHGAGKQQALDNTRELAESWVEAARANGQDITLAELAADAQYEPLFSLADSNGHRPHGTPRPVPATPLPAQTLASAAGDARREA